MSTYPKRAIDLQAGDIVCMYGARHHIVEVLEPNHYGVVHIRATTEPSETPREMYFDSRLVQVELPAGHRVIAVPIENNPLDIAVEALGYALDNDYEYLEPEALEAWTNAYQELTR